MQISKAMLDEFVTTKNGYKRLVAICRMLHVYFKKPGATIIDTMRKRKFSHNFCKLYMFIIL